MKRHIGGKSVEVSTMAKLYYSSSNINIRMYAIKKLIYINNTDSLATTDIPVFNQLVLEYRESMAQRFRSKWVGNEKAFGVKVSTSSKRCLVWQKEQVDRFQFTRVGIMSKHAVFFQIYSDESDTQMHLGSCRDRSPTFAKNALMQKHICVGLHAVCVLCWCLFDPLASFIRKNYARTLVEVS